MAKTCIPFNGEMMRATKLGRKSQTRRKAFTPSEGWSPEGYGEVHRIVRGEPDPDKVLGWGPTNCTGDEAYPCPYGQPGSVLWVKESWAVAKEYDRLPPSQIMANAPRGGTVRVWYPAAGTPKPEWAGRTRVPRFMPKWASRVSIRLTAIRAERLGDITEYDALREGVTIPSGKDGEILVNLSYPAFSLTEWRQSPARCNFAGLWETIHGAGSWEADAGKWLWVLSFEVASGESGEGVTP